jgi:hypothetical protein
MALVSPKMALKIWNLLSDPYDHDQLADNWAKVDQHDHTSNRGVQIPTEGIFDGAITSSKLASGLDPAPAYTTWKVLRHVGGAIAGSTIAGIYGLSETMPSAQPINQPLFYTYFDPADYAVAGRNTMLRIQATVVTNATAPAANFTFGLYPAASTSGGLITNGGAVAGSTIAVNAPALNTMTTVNSAEFAAPAAALYVLAVSMSATAAAGSTQSFRAQLQLRQA